MSLMHSKYSMPSALETRSTYARSNAALGYLKVEGLRVKYIGPGNSDDEAASIRTNFPVPQDSPLYYFEVTILSKGVSGYIGIGYMTDEVYLSRLPGWDSHSYGYHGDDGYAFTGSGNGRPFGPTFTTGDVVGALLSRVDSTIRYFKNGVDVGVAYSGPLEDRLYPCIGLRTRGEEAQLNLGRSGDPAFVADVTGVVTRAKEQVMKTYLSFPLPVANEQGQPLLLALLRDHLLQQRCWKTAGILQRDLEKQAKDQQDQQQQQATSAADVHMYDTAPQQRQAQASGESSVREISASPDPMTMESSSCPAAAVHTSNVATKEGSKEKSSSHDLGNGSSSHDASHGRPGLSDPNHIALRQAVFVLISKGEVLEARQKIQQQIGSSMFAAQPGLDFRLKVAHFCELLRPGGSSAVQAAVTYGRSELAPHTPKSKQDEELLCDALSLLAYDKPQTSPCGILLSQSTRQALAEDVDRALLQAMGYPRKSVLERLVAQTLVALDTLRQQHHPRALLVDNKQVWM